MSSDARTEQLELLYVENAKVVALFLEWRDKVMNRSFAVTGAVFVAAGWLYQEPQTRPFRLAPNGLHASAQHSFACVASKTSSGGSRTTSLTQRNGERYNGRGLTPHRS